MILMLINVAASNLPEDCPAPGPLGADYGSHGYGGCCSDGILVSLRHGWWNWWRGSSLLQFVHGSNKLYSKPGFDGSMATFWILVSSHGSELARERERKKLLGFCWQWMDWEEFLEIKIWFLTRKGPGSLLTRTKRKYSVPDFWHKISLSLYNNLE